MTTLAESVRLDGLFGRLRGMYVPALIFIAAYAVYAFSTAGLSNYDEHQLYLAKAMLSGSLDVAAAGMPTEYLHVDTVAVEDAVYIVFPPGPAILLMPFVGLWGTAVPQAQYGIVLGAVNVVLFWHVLNLLGISRTTQALLIPFFALGTVHYYAATTGTVWQFNHVVAVFFVMVAIVLLLRGANPALIAVALGFAVISRGAVLMSAPFFLWYMYKQQEESISWRGITNREWLLNAGRFCAGLAPFGVLILAYNAARFGDPLDSGYAAVYETYVNSDIPYNYLRANFPDAGHFSLFDVRNIPLHIHALFMLAPEYHADWSIFRPSPYGLSVLFTSPAFVYAFFVRRKTALKSACWLAIGLVSIPLFLHYSQGWAQYGYRFLLDFAPFLLILTAFGFDDNDSAGSRRLQIALVAISIVAGVWGRYWATQWVI